MNQPRKPLTSRLFRALVATDEPEQRNEIARVLGLDVEDGVIDLRSPLPSLVPQQSVDA